MTKDERIDRRGLLGPAVRILGAVTLLGLCALPNPAPAQGTGVSEGGQKASEGSTTITFGSLGEPSPYDRIVDPTHNSVMRLVMRDDVRNEILLDLKQRRAIDALKKSSEADLAVKAQAHAQANIQGSDLQRSNPDPNGDAQGRSSDERQALQQQMDDLRTSAQVAQKEIDRKIEALLRPAQIKRLHELDLQWRGPLALGDPQAAAPLYLTPDQKQNVNGLLLEYHTAMAKAMRSFKLRLLAQPAPRDPGNPQDPAAFRNQIESSMELAQKEMNRVRTALGAKVLSLLTVDQQQTWKTLMGKPFTFRDLAQ